MLIDGNRRKIFFCHELGKFLSKENIKFGYIPIPKNISTLLKYIFAKKFNWQYNYNYYSIKNDEKKFIVCLRDPIDRWTSGVSEYIYRNHYNCDLNNKELLKFIFERTIFDEHTEPQVSFLHGLNTEDIIFIKYEKNMNNVIKQLINEQIDKDFTWEVSLPFSMNLSTMIPSKKNNIFILKKELSSNLKYYNLINEFYQKDIELISAVNFYKFS